MKSNWPESNEHLPKTKSEINIAEITTQKVERYLPEGRKFESFCLLTWSPDRFVSTKKFVARVYWKVFCRFWPIERSDLFHVVSVAPICLGILLSWHDFKILVKPRRGDALLCLVSSVNVRQKYFFSNW